MFSVVVVYNEAQTLNTCLLPSLKRQTVDYEYIPVDNTKGQFKSAAEALNYGGMQAKGKYILFIHQDVELASKSWLEDTERILDILPKLGIAGSIGMIPEGKNFADHIVGYVSGNIGQIHGKPFDKPYEVQTLDELLLIVPQEVFCKFQFDANLFDNWHTYGCDLCLTLQENGFKVYVIPSYVCHHHKVTSDAAKTLLYKYQKRLYNKHKEYFGRIYTTCGITPRIGFMLSSIIDILVRKVRMARV